MSEPDCVGECARFFPGSPFRTVVTHAALRLYKSLLQNVVFVNATFLDYKLKASRKMRR